MNAPEQELIQIQQDLCAAWMSRDRATIERILDRDWSVTRATGEVATKSDVLRDAFELGKLTLNSAQVADIKVRIFGDTAVVTGRSTAEGCAAGQSFSVVLRFTDVFVKRPQGWRAVASHATRITP
jgi:ketosteroid isomerase-like protein